MPSECSSKPLRGSLMSLLCAVLSSHVLVAASTATGGGILPPPPPPPPPRDGALPSQLNLVDKSFVLDESADATPSSADLQCRESETDQQKQLESPKDERREGASLVEEISSTKSYGEPNASQMSQTAWESYGNAGSSASDEQQQQSEKVQQTQSYDSPQQSWGYEQSQSTYPNQSYQGQWQQTYDYGQWGTQTQTQQQQQKQQQQFNQQYPQQQRQPYSQVYPSQSQPLVRYTRPQPKTKSSASSFFNMARRKIQIGLDSVSESLDNSKVASSVSSLTSRLGNIGDVISSSVGLSGGRGNVAQNRPMGSSAGVGGQRYHPQQKIMDPRQGLRPKQEFAPPMSELYSLDMSKVEPGSREGGESNVGTEVNLGAAADSGADTPWKDDTKAEVATQYPHDDETTDDESQMEPAAPNMPDAINRQRQTASMSIESSETPNARASDMRRPQPIRQRPPPRREMDRKQSTSTWPNGGALPSSSTVRPRKYTDYDDYESSSFGSKVKSMIGSVPIPNIPRLFKGMRKPTDYDDGAWSDDESKEKSRATTSFSSGPSLQGRRAAYRPKNAVVPRPVMSLLGKRQNLLSIAGSKRCASVGRTIAVLNTAQLALVVFAMREVLPLFYNALTSENGGDLRATILSTILAATDGWAPHAITAAFLISVSISAWIQPTLRTLSLEVASESEAEAAYTQLYLRLISSIPLKKSFPSSIVRKAARAEAFSTASNARLHFFVTLAVAYILLSTVAVLKPAGVAVVSALFHLTKLDGWEERPIVWGAIFSEAKSVGLDLVGCLRGLFDTELEEVRQQPLRVVVVVSLLAALLFVSYLPSLERNRKDNPTGFIDDEDEEEDTFTSLWSNIGSSSATRLSLLSSPRGVEGALDQFTKLRPDRAAAAGMLPPSRARASLMRKKRRRPRSPVVSVSMRPLLREIAYLVTSFGVLIVPLALYIYVWVKNQSNDVEGTPPFSAIPLDGWASLLEMSALLFMANLQVGRATHYAISAANARLSSSLTAFFRTLSGVVAEIQKLAATSSSSDFQAMLTASPTEGVVVNDFWAAHSTRKAWATKGANVQCKNGEVVLVIGSNGSGKSRLLTSISEHMFVPPKSARTTTYARGTIKVAGVDLSKWDRMQLQRRVGVWLHDVRTVSDYASLATGCTLEEILEPVSVMGGSGDSQTSAKERNAVAIAMKITGLGSKLSKQLPSKLSTVVSANEDELKPSPLRPPSYPLSPSDWSLVLLTKVLAQLITGNDNQQSSPNNIAKCLIGSVLLIDDATSQMSEIDEANFINKLRKTGAAVILTSNRWATGRFADRIVVMKDGAIVESGTHSDLINLGPERSLYAMQWNAMSSI